MAGLMVTASTEGEVALTAAATKTVLQIIAPTNHRLCLNSFVVGFDGVSQTQEPIQVEILRQTTAGTMTAVTPKVTSAGAETPLSTAQKTATAEPTAGDILKRYEVHPQGGVERVFRKGEIDVPGGTRLGLRIITPAGVNPNVVAEFDYEE